MGMHARHTHGSSDDRGGLEKANARKKPRHLLRDAVEARPTQARLTMSDGKGREKIRAAPRLPHRQSEYRLQCASPRRRVARRRLARGCVPLRMVKYTLGEDTSGKTCASAPPPLRGEPTPNDGASERDRGGDAATVERQGKGETRKCRLLQEAVQRGASRVRGVWERVIQHPPIHGDRKDYNALILEVCHQLMGERVHHKSRSRRGGAVRCHPCSIADAVTVAGATPLSSQLGALRLAFFFW